MSNKLIEMWAALLAHLPQAIAAGHGESWTKMCREQTADAAADQLAQIAIDRIKAITKLGAA